MKSPDRYRMSDTLNIGIEIATEAETIALAKRLEPYLMRGDVLTLNGTLGAGKTAFARALIRSLCGAEVEVPSPTFNLLLTYECPKGPVYHYDFYRLEDPEEVWELDIEDAYDQAITVMEWVERLEDLAPKDVLNITLTIPKEGADTERHIQIQGGDVWKNRLQTFEPGQQV